MNRCEALKHLVQHQVLADIEDALDELFAEIAAQKEATLEQQESVAELQEIKESFTELLAEIEAGELDAEECAEMIEEIEGLRADEEE